VAEEPMEQETVIADPGTTQHTDAVLGGWDTEAWWDAPAGELAEVAKDDFVDVPVVEVAPVKEESKSAGIGLLGALLALSPLRRRRKNDEESST